ncbi:ribosomal protein S5, C-terminal domain-containing protein [Immersiella caudata]|uniref:Ribosomal protein S5, C-terminal domain-containing protein n=1 Tax=Immersiella caudata TaxID=314043 RepID=A0AA40C5T3_9PEZI|nr:ribosomal protein S5, C-terminal domain-containing protein [Immersiella caudata]
MSAARPAARSLFSRHLACPSIAGFVSPSASPASCRSFHASPQLAAGRTKPARKNKGLSLVNEPGKKPWPEKQIREITAKKFPQYTPEELAELSKIYTKEQMASLQAGEAAIDPRDLTIQGRLRKDPYRINYLDDFSTIQPVIDKRPKRNQAPDPMARFMDLDHFTRDLIEWADQFEVGEVTGTLKKLEDFVPVEFRDKSEAQWPGKVRTDAHESYMAYLQEEAAKGKDGKSAQGGDRLLRGPTDADILSYILRRSSMTDKGLISNSEMAPGLPNKVPGVEGMYKNPVDPEDEGLDEEGKYQDLKVRTGMTVKEILNLRTVVVSRRWVSNQTRLGKVGGTSIAVIAGNEKGWLGLGVAYSTEPSEAMNKALLKSIENMKPILRYEDRTTYGNLECKISGTVVRLFARPPGFGLRVPHQIFEIARAAGIQDLAARIPRSRNSLNTAKATVQALQNQRSPEEIAMGRGKKLVDVRKVYYGGQL